MTSLAVGAVSEPVKLEDSWHLIKLLEQNPPTINELALPKVLAKAK